MQTLTTIASLSTTSNNFNSLFRVFFIFPSRYLWAISLPLTYLALGGIYLPFKVLGLQYRATRLDKPVLSKIKKKINFLIFNSFVTKWLKLFFKIFFLFFFQKIKKKSIKTNGGFTLYAVPFQGSLTDHTLLSLSRNCMHDHSFNLYKRK